MKKRILQIVKREQSKILDLNWVQPLLQSLRSNWLVVNSAWSIVQGEFSQVVNANAPPVVCEPGVRVLSFPQFTFFNICYMAEENNFLK